MSVPEETVVEQVMEISGENMLPWAVYKPYFFLEESNMTSSTYKVYCLLCLPYKIKLLSTSRCSASNLLRHLRMVHPDKVPSSKLTGPGHKKSIPMKRKLENETAVATQEISLQIQEIGEECNTVAVIPERRSELVLAKRINSTNNEGYISQHKVDQLIVDFIVGGFHSTSLVERGEFQDLISGLRPERTIMSKMCLENIISENANSFKCHLQDILAEVSYVALTADAWRARNKCFVGVTAHWLDLATLDRHSAVLACRTTVGTHTYNEVTRILDEVFEEYGIQNKVIQITTDNGLNFAKSSRIFQLDGIDGVEVIEITVNDFEFIGLTSILDYENEETTLYNMPPHERCVVHTMYLIATLDAKEAEKDSLYRNAQKEALSRAQSLWKLQTSNLKNAEFVRDELSQLLVEPKNKFWTSQYEALKYLLQVMKEKMDNLNSVCDGLEIPRFREDDKIFLEEYCKVMKPVAAAIDALLSEKNAFLGIVLPVLYALRRRLVAFKEEANNQNTFVFCYPLVEAVIEGIDARFSSYMLRTDLVLAAVIHPEFQLTWLKDPEKEEAAISSLKEVVRKISIKNSPVHLVEDDDELFDFKRPLAARNNETKWEIELEQYLKYCNGQIKCLHNYPIVKDVFIQYNTALPSSAATEKTFCINGELFTNNHGSAPDLCFEDMLLIKTGIR